MVRRGLHILHLGKYGSYGAAEEHGLSWDDDPVPETVPFYDVQKLYSLCYQDGKARISLDEAVESFALDVTRRSTGHWGTRNIRGGCCRRWILIP